VNCAGLKFQMILKGEDILTSDEHYGTSCYLALECLKQKKYSKKSDMFSVGACIFEWELGKPFMVARDGVDHDVDFYIETHEKGRIIEKLDKTTEEFHFAPDGKGGYERESLTPGRTKRSLFAPILELLCQVDPEKRPSAMEVMNSSELLTILSKIPKFGAEGNHFL
jgi:serine/threonine protein kinase